MFSLQSVSLAAMDSLTDSLTHSLWVFVYEGWSSGRWFDAPALDEFNACARERKLLTPEKPAHRNNLLKVQPSLWPQLLGGAWGGDDVLMSWRHLGGGDQSAVVVVSCFNFARLCFVSCCLLLLPTPVLLCCIATLRPGMHITSLSFFVGHCMGI